MNAAADARGRLGAGRFVDPKVLARIGNLDLIARIVVDGFVSGLHRTLNLGSSTDFAEHRAYCPGDDVRRVDWRVYARTDRLYLKTFEAETNADLVFALDASGSMDYAGRGVNKLDYARFAVASLVHLGARQRDRIGFAAFDDALREIIPPSGRHRDRIMHALERLRPGAGSQTRRCLARLAEGMMRRGIVVVVSDFYLAPEEAVAALDEVRARGHDVLALHVLDPVERFLDLDQITVLEDMESGEHMAVNPPRQREAYRGLVEGHVAALGQAFGERGIDYACFDTSMPLDHLHGKQRSEGRCRHHPPGTGESGPADRRERRQGRFRDRR